jgi:hypothetical protein
MEPRRKWRVESGEWRAERPLRFLRTQKNQNTQRTQNIRKIQIIRKTSSQPPLRKRRRVKAC